MRTQESKDVKLGDNPFLTSLTGPGSTYEGESLDKVITVVAVAGNYGDWTAYFENPDWGKRVAELGNKLPESAAKQLFPDFGKGLKWRN